MRQVGAKTTLLYIDYNSPTLSSISTVKSVSRGLSAIAGFWSSAVDKLSVSLLVHVKNFLSYLVHQIYTLEWPFVDRWVTSQSSCILHKGSMSAWFRYSDYTLAYSRCYLFMVPLFRSFAATIHCDVVAYVCRHRQPELKSMSVIDWRNRSIGSRSHLLTAYLSLL